uniref:Prefoldin 5 n=1 Tax=Amphiprion percula TaxID=161767 RepID=A0A3P8TDA8_AMPPE
MLPCCFSPFTYRKRIARAPYQFCILFCSVTTNVLLFCVMFCTCLLRCTVYIFVLNTAPSQMYVPGTLNDVEHVLVDVGTGYYVEKNVGDSKAFFKRKVDFLTKQIEKIQPALQEKHAMKQAVIEVMNVKIQQLQQSQQASQMVGTTKA